MRNTSALTRFLKDADFQAVVISLKDRFFAHSDSLIGVYKDINKQSSGILSLPLKKRLQMKEEQIEETVRAGEDDDALGGHKNFVNL